MTAILAEPVAEAVTAAGSGVGLGAARPPRTVLEARIVTGAGGGPDKTIINTPRFLGPLGYPTLCAYFRPPDDPLFAQLEAKAQAAAAPLVAVDDRGPLDRHVWGAAARLCQQRGVDIWHGHDYKTNAFGLYARRRHPMLLVSTAHGWVHHTWKTPALYALDRWCLRRYDAVVCVSRDLQEQCRAAGVPAGRLHYLPNAIDTADFRRRQTVEQARAGWNVPPGRVVLGGVGRLAAEKGFDLLIDAVAALVGEGRDVELRLAGEGPEAAALFKQIRLLGLTDRCKLVGYQRDARGFFEGLDAFVLSSRREGLPNVVLEALALEVPVVATPVAEVPHVLADGETGLLTEGVSAPALTAAVRRLLDTPGLAERLAANGRRVVGERYDFARRSCALAEIYDAAWDRWVGERARRG